MRVQTIVVVFLLLVTAVFALMNPALVQEIWTVRIPGASFTGPLLSAILLVGVGAVLAMYAGTAFWYYSVANRLRKLETVLSKQGGVADLGVDGDEVSRKIVDDLAGKIEAVRIELSEQIVELGRMVEDRIRDLTSQPTE